MKSIVNVILVLFFLSCGNTTNPNREQSSDQITNKPAVYSVFDSIPKTKVMVVGTYHFDGEQHYDELSAENQEHIKKLVDRFAAFKPTKVVIEIQPQYDPRYQKFYQKYLVDDKAIDTLENEIFQLGFRLAKTMGHKKIYLFDDQTEYIGSLAGFTWEKLGEEVAKDSVFANHYLDIISDSFQENQTKFNALDPYDNIMERNSPEAQNWNAQRMHAYELRAGIQKSWLGPDWVGRWYQRNIRMMANIMAFNTAGKDRIVIIVGDNHKWVLDTLLGFNPDFEVVSSYDLLKRN